MELLASTSRPETGSMEGERDLFQVAKDRQTEVLAAEHGKQRGIRPVYFRREIQKVGSRSGLWCQLGRRWGGHISHWKMWCSQVPLSEHLHQVPKGDPVDLWFLEMFQNVLPSASNFGFSSPVDCYLENKMNFSAALFWGSLFRTCSCAGSWHKLVREGVRCWLLCRSVLGLPGQRQFLVTYHHMLTFMAVIVILTREWQIFMRGAKSLSNSVLVQCLPFHAVVIRYC